MTPAQSRAIRMITCGEWRRAIEDRPPSRATAMVIPAIDAWRPGTMRQSPNLPRASSLGEKLLVQCPRFRQIRVHLCWRDVIFFQTDLARHDLVEVRRSRDVGVGREIIRAL